MRNLARAAAVVALIAAYGLASWPGLIVAGAGVYALSLKLSRYRPCRTCGGGKTRGDIVSGRAYDYCWSCKGTGEHPRLGVRLFRRAAYREIMAARRRKG